MGRAGSRSLTVYAGIWRMGTWGCSGVARGVNVCHGKTPGPGIGPQDRRKWFPGPPVVVAFVVRINGRWPRGGIVKGLENVVGGGVAAAGRRRRGHVLFWSSEHLEVFDEVCL